MAKLEQPQEELIDNKYIRYCVVLYRGRQIFKIKVPSSSSTSLNGHPVAGRSHQSYLKVSVDSLLVTIRSSKLTWSYVKDGTRFAVRTSSNMLEKQRKNFIQ
jgi:hypothetical protein